MFHKGRNISNYRYEKLENLGVENLGNRNSNYQFVYCLMKKVFDLDHIKILRDEDLPKRSPRSPEQQNGINYFNPKSNRYPNSTSNGIQLQQ